MKPGAGSCASCRSRDPAILLARCPSPKLYDWSVTIGTACAKQMRTFVDLVEKLKMDVTDCASVTRRAPPSKALVKGLARELDISESYLDKLAEEVRKDLGVM
jgi:hypothetical protein